MDRPQIKFVVVGSVDHGKSTLIGRLLYDNGAIPPAQLAHLRELSRLDGRDMDFAFVLDHLQEERSRHITIDTAQTFFRGGDRDYVIIDAPGHREFLQNMLTGATQASAAVLVVDLAEGLTPQSCRHGVLLGMLGITQVIVAVNKMDLVGHSRDAFAAAARKIRQALLDLGIRPLAMIPTAAVAGDNVAVRAASMPWYSGPTVMEALALLEPREWNAAGPLRLPVQDVYKHNGSAAVVGRILSGELRVGQSVTIYPAQHSAVVKALLKFPPPGPEHASAGESVAISLADSGGLARGEVIALAESPPLLSSTLQARVFWISPRPLLLRQQFCLRLSTQQVACQVRRIMDRTDAGTLSLLESNAVELRQAEVATLELTTDAPVIWDPFVCVPEMGRVVLSRDAEVVAGGTLFGPSEG